jgi:hypothetical protein
VLAVIAGRKESPQFFDGFRFGALDVLGEALAADPIAQPP